MGSRLRALLPDPGRRPTAAQNGLKTSVPPHTLTPRHNHRLRIRPKLLPVQQLWACIVRRPILPRADGGRPAARSRQVWKRLPEALPRGHRGQEALLQEDLPERARRRESDPQLWMDQGREGEGVLLNSSGRVQHRRLRLRRCGRLQLCHHEFHLCDCRPLHHGAWLPDTLDHLQLSKRRADNTPVGRTETEFSKHTKTFPRKKRCDHQTNLFDLRCCLQILENLRLSKSPLAASCLLPRTVINPDAWVFVVQLGCET